MDKQGECSLIDQKFVNFNGHSKDESLASLAIHETAKMEENVNQNNIPWRILMQKLTWHVREDKKTRQLGDSLPDGLFAITLDEKRECQIYDATC